MAKIKVCVFDAYGTLFDVNAAARDVAAQPGKEAFSLVWQQVSTDWRVKTLQYSWLRTITGDYVDFWQLTQDALDWALAASDQTSPELREDLLGLFWKLGAFAEVPDVLGALKQAGHQTAILSNGSPEMLRGAVESAGLQDLLDAVLSVETLQTFKPSRAVYDLVGGHFDAEPGEVLFVSSNGWDAAAAAAYGFDTLWVNRAGEPQDLLPGRPGRTSRDLMGVLDAAGPA
ncbi:MAG: haloacid dehalogenase type II [Pseudomonadota bacterium]